MSNKQRTAVELAKFNATTAPPGVRLGGPGTRSKNPARYDRNKRVESDDT